MARDIKHLQTALTRALPDGDRITGVEPLSTGHSNETYLLAGHGGVLRLPPSEEPLVRSAHGVLTQAEICRALAALPGAPPVPAIRHVEPGTALLGDPFYVMDFIEGKTFSEYEVPAWLSEPDDAFRSTVIDNYVDAFASIHGLGVAPILGAPRAVAEEIEVWRRVADDAGHAELLALFEELAAAAPEDGAPTFVHGDPKPVNVLFSGSTVNAVVDWEMSFNGDPRWDLGYMLVFFAGRSHPAFTGCDLPGMPGGPGIVARWQERTGRDATGVAWFEAASFAKITALLAYGVHLAANGSSADERLSEWAPYVEFFLSQTRAAVDALRTGVAPA